MGNHVWKAVRCHRLAAMAELEKGPAKEVASLRSWVVCVIYGPQKWAEAE